MNRRFIPLLCLLSTSYAWAGNVSVNEAALAAQSVPRPNYGSMVTNEKRDDVVNTDFIGDTSSLSDLRGESGMGDLFTPGSNKANACLNQNNPECLAVQLVYQGGANKPELTEEEKDNILGAYENVIDNADQLVGESGSLVSTETHCETVSTVIPGLSEIEVCDEASAGIVSGTCSEGWAMEMGTRELYRCHTQALSDTKVCHIDREALYHTENRYACVKAPAQFKDTKCTVPVTVNIQKTYPYQCRVEQTPPSTQTCVKTLSVDIIPACPTDQRASVSLKPFTEVGYSGSASNLTAHVSYRCSDQMEVTVKFGTRAMGTFTQAPASVTKTNRIEFVISLAIIKKSNRDYYEVTITNTDKGKGTRTVTVELPILLPNHQEMDSWEVVCR